MTGDHHLRDTLAVVDDKLLLRQVDQQHAYLSTIVGIDGAWRVQDGNTLLEGQTATRTDLCLITDRKRDVQSGRNQSALHGLQHDGCFEICSQIHACTLFRGVLW